MTVRTLAEIKALFETGDIPSGQDFEDLVDSLAALENLQTGAALEGQAIEADGSGGAELSEVKEYVALLTQEGTSAPVAIVLKNTFGGSIVWSRFGAGIYVGTLSGAFVSDKTAIIVAPSIFAGDYGIGAKRNASNTVWIQTFTIASQLETDEILNNTMVKIYVYP